MRIVVTSFVQSNYPIEGKLPEMTGERDAEIQCISGATLLVAFSV